jgi:hypothetical protein
MADKSDKVGYGRPPVHSRFKPGQSGNPRGRPKGTLNFTTDLKRTLQAPVTLNDGRKTRRVTTQEAALLRLAEKALKGDPRALEKLVSLSATLSTNNAESPSKTMAADDQAILDRYRQLILNETNSPFETDDDDEK